MAVSNAWLLAPRRARWAALAALVAVLGVTAGCSKDNGQASSPEVSNLPEPKAAFDTLSRVSLGCAISPHLLSANGARVATCGPIASIPGSNLAIGQYPTAAIAEAQYRAHCDASGGWSLYRHGENWRGVITGDEQPVPRSVAVSIARALDTDLHAPCPNPPTPTPSASA